MIVKAILEIELRDDNIVQMARYWNRALDGLTRVAAAGALTSRHRSQIKSMLSPGYERFKFGTFKPSGWCAKIAGTDARFGYAREFCEFKKDYSRANSKGSRGVYAIYCLDWGELYEVKDGKRRYFCMVIDWKIEEVPKEEVDQWLKSNSASTFLKRLANG